MKVSFIAFLLVHLAALIFLVESFRRIRKRSKEYPLRETPDTLPFGFVRLRHWVILYGVTYVAWVVFSVWFYYVFVDPNLFS